MNHRLFFENMKLADLILTNYRLLFVFPRFGIGIGLGDNTIKQVCTQKKISVPLFLLVCNVYTFDEYLPEKHVLDKIPLNELITYLRNSHKEYLTTHIPQITNEILEMTQSCHHEIFIQFCEKYEEEVVKHFQYEEKVVFPYITSLIQGYKVDNYNIEKYEENHSNIEETLNDLKNILIKYLPDNSSSEKNKRTLIDLFLLEDDLNKHTLLENKILVSLVEQMEKNIK